MYIQNEIRACISNRASRYKVRVKPRQLVYIHASRIYKDIYKYIMRA